MMMDADAFYHTHPAAWEPSQSSPEDFMVYHGMFTNLGICDHFTVMVLDWFHFPKNERFGLKKWQKSLVNSKGHRISVQRI